ncbi:AcrR family transcriptional regulator [Bacterioplanes sanyensis]|uniref:TetR/AcrR family transcriptional regulator n=1 Tax=Bacterioplanes sanyensis TaxID=1249553 RepID=UPI0016793876|nr:TetR/AcrR family transcriptional regulator [Bacterioplanes sanyensis]GGY56761.1 AcrR family transcriptional regulator [Bacterioplanes sanyensis]
MAYRETEHTRQRKAETRQRLLEAARQLVAEQGFAAATAAAVAHRSGVAAGTIYRHFPNKSELVAEVFRYATEHEIAQVKAASELGQSASEHLHHAIHVFAQRALQGATLAYALIAEPVDPRVEQERLKYRFAYAELFEDLIHSGIEAQEFSQQDTAVSAAALVGLLAEALVGPLSQRFRDQSRDSNTPDNHYLIEQLVTLSLRLLGANPSR